jgi:hypothetical protein
MFGFLRKRFTLNPSAHRGADEIRVHAGVLGIPTYRQSLEGMRAELRRARRFGHPLSVVCISPRVESREAGLGSEQLRPPRDDPSGPAAFYLLGSMLRDVLRETDVATFAADPQAYAVFMLETSADDAGRAVNRLNDAYFVRTGLQLRSGVATFPHCGLTVEHLFERALRAWESGYTPLAEVETRSEARNA